MPKVRDTRSRDLLLYDVNTPKNPDIPYWSYERFNLDLMTDDKCETEFRFYKNDIYELSEILNLPDRIVCYNGVNVDREAFCIKEKGAAIQNCWGFIDGKVRPISRPGRNQHVMYNGHKKVHSIKFQFIATPNGLIANLYGPVEGKRHDSAMLA